MSIGMGCELLYNLYLLRTKNNTLFKRKFWLDYVKPAELIVVSIEFPFHPYIAHKVIYFCRRKHWSTIKETDFIFWWLDYYMSVEMSLPKMFSKQLH